MLFSKHAALPDAGETKTDHHSKQQTLGNPWQGREEWRETWRHLG
jgi:hypothetical protein